MKKQSESTTATPFWEKPLQSLSDSEWEQLCDGCGRCCLKKLCDEDSGEILYTRVICRYFDQRSSRCGCYQQRTEKVPDCLRVREHAISELDWIPDTCAYKLRHEGRPLYDWHPLIAGSRRKMEEQGIAVAGRVLSEELVHERGLEEHVINWVSADG
ncbi:MAG: YcgN family cysteine cluster protein [Gammaproteobacteria bacterium]|nr:YcgN family cysteine cluster protein [Pseudomonadales bacterium]MCP5346284.1 YcgN family cysteine cluster protein [Pseudomonadales bacterium]